MDREPVINLKKISVKPDNPSSVKSAPTPKGATITTGMPNANGQKILIIEDDDFLRGLLTTKLKKSGYLATDSPTAERGIELMTMLKPDIILLDLMLPGMNGFEFLSERNSKGYEATKTIVLSNLGSKDDIDHAIGLGAIDYLIKANFSLEGIVERVAFHLNETSETK